VQSIIKEDIEFVTTRRLWYAISQKDLDGVKRELTKGAKYNLRNSQGQTALHLATEKDENSIVELLLEAGPDINAKDKKGHTAVQLALLGGKYEILRSLLRRGAAVDEEDKQKTKDEHCKELLGLATYVQGPFINRIRQTRLPSRFDKA
jgi:ankyrin repeat protein